MLYLIVQAGPARFALEALQVAEVIPLLHLQPWPAQPPVVGAIRYDNMAVPVIDLGQAVGSAPTPEPARLSHRLVLVRHPHRPESLLALRVERAAETLRANPAEFKPPPASWDNHAPVTGVRLDATGTILALDLTRLMPRTNFAEVSP